MIASSVCHAQKWYWRDAPLGEQNAREHDKLANPKWIVQSILSCEHQKLGEREERAFDHESLRWAKASNVSVASQRRRKIDNTWRVSRSRAIACPETNERRTSAISVGLRSLSIDVRFPITSDF